MGWKKYMGSNTKKLVLGLVRQLDRNSCRRGTYGHQLDEWWNN